MPKCGELATVILLIFTGVAIDKIIRRPLENHRKPQENHRKTIGKASEKQKKTIGKT